jgi:hypothetical protein
MPDFHGDPSGYDGSANIFRIICMAGMLEHVYGVRQPGEGQDFRVGGGLEGTVDSAGFRFLLRVKSIAGTPSRVNSWMGRQATEITQFPTSF